MAEALTGERGHFWLKRRALLARSSRQFRIQTPTIGPGSRQRPSGSGNGVSYESQRSRPQPLDLAMGASEQELRLFQGGHKLQSDGERRDDPVRPW